MFGSASGQTTLKDNVRDDRRQFFFLFLFENVCFVRPNLDELKSHLTDLGANYVLTEEELKSSKMKEIMKVSCKRIV